MKQFTRCTNCRQWYTQRAITTVEIVRGSGLQRTTVWCRQCIQDAEQRSQCVADHTGTETLTPVTVAPTDPESGLHALPPDFHQLVQEHFDLMERALHEDEAILIPLIDAFMQRCHTYQGQLVESDLRQRLLGHLHYWQAFLHAFHQSH